MRTQRRIDRVLDNSGFMDLVRQGADWLARGNYGEPYFFSRFGEEGIVNSDLFLSPEGRTEYVPQFLQFVDERIKGDFLPRLIESADTSQDVLEEMLDVFGKFAQIEILLHLHPDSYLEPSSEDLADISWHYDLHSIARGYSPVHAIGRINNGIDIIFIRQNKDVDRGLFQYIGDRIRGEMSKLLSDSDPGLNFLLHPLYPTAVVNAIKNYGCYEVFRSSINF